MTSQQVADLLGTQIENIRKSKGDFRFHSSYYWGITKDATSLVEMIKTKIPTAIIVDSGNHYHGFVGGAESGSAQDSFLWVKFTV